MQSAAQSAYFQPVAQTPASAPVPQDPALPRAGALEMGVETTSCRFMRQADSCNAAVREMRPSAADRCSHETSCSWPPRLRRFHGSAGCTISQAVSAETAHLPTGSAGTSCHAADQARIGVGTRCRPNGRADVPYESRTPAAAVDLPRPVGSLDDLELDWARLDGRAAAMAADLQPAPSRDADHTAVLGEPGGSSDRGRLASPV